jgi:hypothetical protein
MLKQSGLVTKWAAFERENLSNFEKKMRKGEAMEIDEKCYYFDVFTSSVHFISFFFKEQNEKPTGGGKEKEKKEREKRKELR